MQNEHRADPYLMKKFMEEAAILNFANSHPELGVTPMLKPVFDAHQRIIGIVMPWAGMSLRRVFYE